MALFIADTRFVVYMNAKDPKPSQELHSREELNQYEATTHFVGQSTIFTLTGERATGEAYCLAHHVTVDGSKRRLMVASLRLPRHVREIRWRLDVLGATAVRRLGGRTRTIMTAPEKHLQESLSSFQAPVM